jgi:hypothetical protein
LYYSIQSFLNTDELTQTLAGVEIASEKFFTLPHFPFAVPLNGADRGGGGGGVHVFSNKLKMACARNLKALIIF